MYRGHCARGNIGGGTTGDGEEAKLTTDEHGCHKTVEGRARYSVRAVAGIFVSGGQGTSRPAIRCFIRGKNRK
jgi:hypothetical protein